MKIVIPAEYRDLFAEDIMTLEDILEVVKELNNEIDRLKEREEN